MCKSGRSPNSKNEQVLMSEKRQFDLLCPGRPSVGAGCICTAVFRSLQYSRRTLFGGKLFTDEEVRNFWQQKYGRRSRTWVTDQLKVHQHPDGKSYDRRGTCSCSFRTKTKGLAADVAARITATRSVTLAHRLTGVIFCIR